MMVPFTSLILCFIKLVSCLFLEDYLLELFMILTVKLSDAAEGLSRLVESADTYQVSRALRLQVQKDDANYTESDRWNLNELPTLADPSEVDSDTNVDGGLENELEGAHFDLHVLGLHLEEIVPAYVLLACDSESDDEAQEASHQYQVGMARPTGLQSSALAAIIGGALSVGPWCGRRKGPPPILKPLGEIPFG
jgi:hypothetical protein